MATSHLGTPTAVYRFFDADGRLLYVGMTGNIQLRWRTHAADKPWWPEVARQATVWYETRAEAAVAESEAIRGEDPLYNISGTPRQHDAREAGLERRRRRIEMEANADLPRIRAKRSGKYWELHVDGVGVTQARNLHSDADEMIRSYIATKTGEVVSPGSYCIVAEIDEETDALVAEARQAAREAEEAVAIAAASNRAVVRDLSAAGLTGRDIATVLGLTPQRVSQLMAPVKAAA